MAVPQAASTTYKSDGLCLRCVVESEKSVSCCAVGGKNPFFHWTNHGLAQMKTISPLPNRTLSHIYGDSSLFPNPWHASKTGTDYSPAFFFWLWLLLGFQVPSCVHSISWDEAWCTTHGGYYPSQPRVACGSLPFQIELPRLSSCPQPFKHSLSTLDHSLNHTDSFADASFVWQNSIVSLGSVSVHWKVSQSDNINSKLSLISCFTVRQYFF